MGGRIGRSGASFIGCVHLYVRKDNIYIYILGKYKYIYLPNRGTFFIFRLGFFLLFYSISFIVLDWSFVPSAPLRSLVY